MQFRRCLPVGAIAVAGGLYPFAVFFGSARVPSGVLALGGLVLVLARFRLVRKTLTSVVVPPLVCAATAIGALGLLNADAATHAYPLVMTLSAAAAFGLSLVRPPCLIERLVHGGPAPDPATGRYMRQASAGWCSALLLNAVLSALTWASGDLQLWTFYNGFAAYILLGAVFCVEFAVRQFVRRQRHLRQMAAE